MNKYQLPDGSTSEFKSGSLRLFPRRGKQIFAFQFWARSLVISDLRSETKGSRFESSCQLCAEVSSLQ